VKAGELSVLLLSGLNNDDGSNQSIAIAIAARALVCFSSTGIHLIFSPENPTIEVGWEYPDENQQRQ